MRLFRSQLPGEYLMTRSKGPQDEGRRGALKKIDLGAGVMVSLPILGQGL